MIWMCVGCRHQESDVEMREKLAFSESQIRAALASLREMYPDLEVVILSTCNRVEVYAAMEISDMEPGTFPKNAEAGVEILLHFLADFHHLEYADVSAHCFRFTGQDVVEHLFNVVTSLDSMIVGEAQIAGQVRAAYDLAIACGSVRSLLHAAFQRAQNLAKKVATQTVIHHYRTSVPSVAVSCFAKQIFEHFETKRTLVIGAGKMAEETLQYLREEGVCEITIVNRNREHAEAMAAEFRGKIRPWEELDSALIEADLVVSTTASPLPIVTAERFRKLEPRRGMRSLFVLDLAVPRDFDPRLKSFPNVYLYTVDDLQSVCDKNQSARDRDLPKVRAIVKEELKTFVIDIRHHKSAQVIARLRERWQEPKRAELARLLHKLPDLTDEQRQEVEYAFDRLVNKLLHLPMESLRDEAATGAASQRGLLDAMRKLFRL